MTPVEPTTDLSVELPVRKNSSVLVVTFDALRADALGVYGNPRGTTPNLDAFARQGVVFDAAYTAAPVTPTSFAAAWSGMLPTRVFRAWRFTAPKTLAERFREKGYRTAAFVNNVQLAPERSFNRGFDTYSWGRSESDEATIAQALAWLENDGKEPFFAWIHLLRPHAPYVYRDSARHLYDPTYRGAFEVETGPQFAPEAPADIARVRSLYEGNVFHADQIFGWLSARLDGLGILDRTIVVVSADHGEEFFEHGRFQHGFLTEEHIRIPLILRHPESRRASRSALLASNLDFAPTLLALTGNPVTDDLDGRNLLVAPPGPRAMVSVAMTHISDVLVSLRVGTRKLILTCGPVSRRQYFDLASDPGELNDLAPPAPSETDDPAVSVDPKVYAAVLREIGKAEQQLGRVLGGPPCEIINHAVAGADATRDLDAESIKALRSLGYL